MISHFRFNESLKPCPKALTDVQSYCRISHSPAFSSSVISGAWSWKQRLDNKCYYENSFICISIMQYIYFSIQPWKLCKQQNLDPAEGKHKQKDFTLLNWILNLKLGFCLLLEPQYYKAEKIQLITNACEYMFCFLNYGSLHHTSRLKLKWN